MDEPETIEEMWKIFRARVLDGLDDGEIAYLHGVFFCGAQAVMALIADGVLPSAVSRELDQFGREVMERARQMNRPM